MAANDEARLGILIQDPAHLEKPGDHDLGFYCYEVVLDEGIREYVSHKMVLTKKKTTKTISFLSDDTIDSKIVASVKYIEENRNTGGEVEGRERPIEYHVGFKNKEIGLVERAKGPGKNRYQFYQDKELLVIPYKVKESLERKIKEAEESIGKSNVNITLNDIKDEVQREIQLNLSVNNELYISSDDKRAKQDKPMKLYHKIAEWNALRVNKEDPSDPATIVEELVTRPALNEERNFPWIRSVWGKQREDFRLKFPTDPSKIPLTLAICVTIYNEDLKLFQLTMRGIAENVMTFKKRGIPFENIAVFVIADGIQFFNEDFLDFFDRCFDISAAEGIFKNPLRSKIAKIWPRGRNNIPKDFQWPYHVSKRSATMLETVYVENLDEGEARVNTFFVTKHANAGKLSSHLWFFRGFCLALQPSYCLLIDVGTVADQEAILKLALTLDTFPNVGGVCGHMGVDNPTFFGVEGAQLFEYKFAHLLDKAAESFFGFIHVLPGAFSAYRWEAISAPEIMGSYLKLILNPEYTEKVLDDSKAPKFLETKKVFTNLLTKKWLDVEYEFLQNEFFSCMEGNMYLAEDRILCLKIFAQTNKDFILKYVPDAYCKTDVIDSFVQLMNQRRRWINGTWWAFWEVFLSSTNVFRRGNLIRTIPFFISLFYATFQMVMMWFVVSIFYVSFNVMIYEFFGSTPADYFSWYWFFHYSYNILIITLFFTSILYKAREASETYTLMSHIFGVLNLMITVLTAFFIYQKIYQTYYQADGMAGWDIVSWLMVAVIAGHAIPVMLNGEIMTILRGLLAFFYYAPSYINILIIYSFCNFDDLTWGNRAESGHTNNSKLEDLAKKAKSFKNFKIKYVLYFGVSNIAVSYVLLYFIQNNADFRSYYILIFSFYVTGTLLFKTVFGLLYMLEYWFDKIKMNAQMQSWFGLHSIDNTVRLDGRTPLLSGGYVKAVETPVQPVRVEIQNNHHTNGNGLMPPSGINDRMQTGTGLLGAASPPHFADVVPPQSHGRY